MVLLSRGSKLSSHLPKDLIQTEQLPEELPQSLLQLVKKWNKQQIQANFAAVKFAFSLLAKNGNVDAGAMEFFQGNCHVTIVIQQRLLRFGNLIGRTYFEATKFIRLAKKLTNQFIQLDRMGFRFHGATLKLKTND